MPQDVALGAISRYSKTVSFLEFVDATARIDEFLFAREKRVAFTANVDLYNVGVLRRARLESLAARALNGNYSIFRMDIRFHFSYLAQFLYLIIIYHFARVVKRLNTTIAKIIAPAIS